MMASGELITRYGVVSILLAFGMFKFTNTEAQAIRPLIDNSPLFSWMNHLFNTRTISSIIGIVEIIAAIGIGVRFMSLDIAFYGSLLGCIIFLSTSLQHLGCLSKSNGYGYLMSLLLKTWFYSAFAFGALVKHIPRNN